MIGRDWRLRFYPLAAIGCLKLERLKGNASCSYLKSTNQFENIELIKDYAGFDRVVVSQRK